MATRHGNGTSVPVAAAVGEYAQGQLVVDFGAQLVVAEVADQNAEEPIGRCRVGNVAEHGTK